MSRESDKLIEKLNRRFAVKKIIHPKKLISADTEKTHGKKNMIRLNFEDGSVEEYHKNDPEFLRMQFNLTDR